MKTFRVELDPQALAEMLDAAEYIARDSDLSADRWLEGLAEVMASLSTMPRRCGIARE